MVDKYSPKVSHWASKTHRRHTAGFYARSAFRGGYFSWCVMAGRTNVMRVSLCLLRYEESVFVYLRHNFKAESFHGGFQIA